MYFNLEQGKRTLRLGAVPTQNLPQKSHETFKSPERRIIIKNVSPINDKKNDIYYKNYEDLYVRKHKIKNFMVGLLTEMSQICH